MERSLKLDLSKNPLFEALTFRGKERGIFERLITIGDRRKLRNLRS